MSEITKQWIKLGNIADIPDPAVARAAARDQLIEKRDGMPRSASLSQLDGADQGLVDAQLQFGGNCNTFEGRLPEYLTYCATKKPKKRKGPNKPTTVYEKGLVINKHVMPHWCHRDVKTIKPLEAEGLIDGLAHLPGSQYRVYSVLHHFFTWARRKEYTADHPMAEMGAPYEYIPRDRVLASDEIRWFWMACDQVGYPLGAWGKMLLLTVQRSNEVTKMSRWNIDEHFVWKLTAEMTKSRRPHVVFFSDFAQEVFAQIPHVGQSGLVFVGAKEFNTCQNRRKLHSLMLEFKRRELAARGHADVRHVTIDHWVFHDLRRTGATIMAKLQHPKDIVHKILNHSDGSRGPQGMLDQTYIIWEFLEQRRKALQDLGDYVKRLVAPSLNG